MKLDPSLFCILLKSCAESENLEFGKILHSRIVGTELEKDVYVVSNLITFYGKCGCLDSARRVFDEMSRKNEVTWTSMISMYSQLGYVEEGLELYKVMKLEGDVRPNAFTYSVVLNLCAKVRNVEMGIEVHEDIVKDGCESDEFVVTALIDMYAKCGRIESACRVFRKVKEPTIAACTAKIDGYNNNNEAKEAMSLIRRLLQRGLDIKSVRALGFTCFIRSCTAEAVYRPGKEIHAHMIKFGYEMSSQTLSALVMLYEKCDRMVLARRLFDKLGGKSEDLWRKMISGYVRSKMHKEAFELYVEMVFEDVTPSSSALSSALKACVGMLGVKEGMEIQARAIKLGYRLSDDSVAVLVNLYNECRLPEEVRKLRNGQRRER
ncbi:hypothetical protein ACHQM5_030349 [Ranunculus cassubicifolius]